MDIYYHYTTPESALAIIRTGVIKRSTKRARRLDARHGDGVYLTQMPPTTPKHWIAFNNYDGTSEPAIVRMMNRGRVDAYIRLRLKRSEVMECEDELYGRDIFLYPDQDLHIQPYMNAELGIID